MDRYMRNRLLLMVILLLVAILVWLLVLALGVFPEEPKVPQPSNATAEVTTTVQTTQQTTTFATQTATVPTTTVYVPTISPNTVGIYIPAEDGTAARKRITEFSSKRTVKKDIDCFEFLASRDSVRPGYSFKRIWSDAWNSFDNGQDTRIGLVLTLTLKNADVITKQILKPSDCQSFYEYLEVYLYDDVHQSGWYSHLEDKDMKAETIITSAKLTSGTKIGEVGDIVLTAFLYSGPDCFDKNGNYIGTVLETIVIKEA